MSEFKRGDLVHVQFIGKVINAFDDGEGIRVSVKVNGQSFWCVVPVDKASLVSHE